MERKEAMLWLTTMEQAAKGDEAAIRTLQIENKLRKEDNLPTIEEEIEAMRKK